MGQDGAPGGAHHGHHHHPDAALARAERVCAARGLRLTPVRRRVLEALARSAQPLGAYDLAGGLSADKRLSAVSVYRALDFLEEAGLVHRLSTRPAYVACSHDHEGGEAIVFLVCETCGGVDEVGSESLERDLAAVSAGLGFRLEKRAVEIQGRCQDCLTEAAPAPVAADSSAPDPSAPD